MEGLEPLSDFKSPGGAFFTVLQTNIIHSRSSGRDSWISKGSHIPEWQAIVVEAHLHPLFFYFSHAVISE
jgi:hypothetical protein